MWEKSLNLCSHRKPCASEILRLVPRTAIMRVKCSFRFPSAHRSSVCALLQPIKCAIALWLKESNVHTLVKKCLLPKYTDHPLSFPWVIVTDHKHHNKYNNVLYKIIWRSLGYCKSYVKWAKAVGKNGAERLARCWAAPNFQFVKNAVCVKCSKTRSACMWPNWSVSLMHLQEYKRGICLENTLQQLESPIHSSIPPFVHSSLRLSCACFCP